MKSVIISTRLLTLWVLAGSSMSSCSQPTGQLLSLTSLFFHPPPLPRGLLCSGVGGETHEPSCKQAPYNRMWHMLRMEAA